MRLLTGGWIPVLAVLGLVDQNTAALYMLYIIYISRGWE